MSETFSLATSSDRRAPGTDMLVLRAVFVPDGEQPPPEFLSDFDPLRIAATDNPTTGEITCINAVLSFDGDLRASWHPDEDPETYGDAPGVAGKGGAKQPAGQRRAGGDAPSDGAGANRPEGSKPGLFALNSRPHTADIGTATNAGPPKPQGPPGPKTAVMNPTLGSFTLIPYRSPRVSTRRGARLFRGLECRPAQQPLLLLPTSRRSLRRAMFSTPANRIRIVTHMSEMIR